MKLYEIFKYCLLSVTLALSSLVDARAEAAEHERASQYQYIFGYGSLTNSVSRERSLGFSAPATPVRISDEFGYVRAWNHSSSVRRCTFLGLAKPSNITPCNALSRIHSTTINGVIYPVTQDDLAVWDARESGYNRTEIPWKFIQQVNDHALPRAGTVWVYIPKTAKGTNPSSSHPIEQHYVDMCVLGFLEYGEDFAQEMLRTTYNWSPHWVNDRNTPGWWNDRPEEQRLKEYAIVDRLIAENDMLSSCRNKQSECCSAGVTHDEQSEQQPPR